MRSMFFLCVLVCSGCGGGDDAGAPGKIGEACGTQGSTAPCVQGAVCGKDTSASLLCLKTCTDQNECAASQECNGVDGSALKACRTKTK